MTKIYRFSTLLIINAAYTTYNPFLFVLVANWVFIPTKKKMSQTTVSLISFRFHFEAFSAATWLPRQLLQEAAEEDALCLLDSRVLPSMNHPVCLIWSPTTATAISIWSWGQQSSRLIFAAPHFSRASADSAASEPAGCTAFVHP